MRISATFQDLGSRVKVFAGSFVTLLLALFFVVGMRGWDTVASISLWALVPICCVGTLLLTLQSLWEKVAAQDAWYTSKQCRSALVRKIRSSESPLSDVEKEALLALLCIREVSLITYFSRRAVDTARTEVAENLYHEIRFMAGIGFLIQRGILESGQDGYVFGEAVGELLPVPPEDQIVGELRPV